MTPNLRDLLDLCFTSTNALSFFPCVNISFSGGRRESPKTVKPPKFFRGTEKPPQNSAKAVITFFHNLDVPPRFCVGDDCLVIIVMSYQGKANSSALNPPENVKISRMFTKLYRTEQLFIAFIVNFVII